VVQGGDVTGQPRAIFVSYAGVDRAWAEWVAWELSAARYSVELDVWDWHAGDSAVRRMDEALQRAAVVVALFSPAYFEEHRFTRDEWEAVLTARPDRRQRLIPLRVAEVTPPSPLLARLVWKDLFDLAEEHARTALLTAVGELSGRPTTAPPFPTQRTTTPAGVATGPRPSFPGGSPTVWKVPSRNAAFTGRDGMLTRLRDLLRADRPVVVQALHGMGGVGKTQLAVEYAHRFAADYDLVWWIDSEQPDLIGEQLTELAVAMTVAQADTATPSAVAAVHAQLRRQGRWLLIFDNADNPRGLRAWLPQGPGHVLITSRNPVWGNVADPLPVDVFARAETQALLRRDLPALGGEDADRLGEALGDLPLAVAQAAGLMAETGLTAAQYITELDRHTAQVTDEAIPLDYPQSLAAAVRTSLSQLDREDPAAGQLLRLCAFLAPEPIPLDLFTGAPADALPEPLASVATATLAFGKSVGRLGRYSLARLNPDGPVLHRLIQAILRDSLDPTTRDETRHRAIQLLVAAQPDDGTTPALWFKWGQLLPHILAADPATTDNHALKYLAYSAVWHLLARGDARAAQPIAQHIHEHWHTRHGPDDRYTLAIAGALARAHRDLGDLHRARALDEDTLNRDRRILGDDHPDTLHSANNLAISLRALGEHVRARALDEDTLTRRRRILGDDHRETLHSANNLANSLRASGEYEQARALDEDTLTRRRRVLGDDHPDTLYSANNLANTLRALGQYEQARALNEDTLARFRRILGDDHPDTLRSTYYLANTLRALGEHVRARALDEDTLTRRRRILGDDHPDTLHSARNLGIDLHAPGKHD
jgi:tetratricopeptide (TPR) repeat protein